MTSVTLILLSGILFLVQSIIAFRRCGLVAFPKAKVDTKILLGERKIYIERCTKLGATLPTEVADNETAKLSGDCKIFVFKTPQLSLSELLTPAQPDYPSISKVLAFQTALLLVTVVCSIILDGGESMGFSSFVAPWLAIPQYVQPKYILDWSSCGLIAVFSSAMFGTHCGLRNRTEFVINHMLTISLSNRLGN